MTEDLNAPLKEQRELLKKINRTVYMQMWLHLAGTAVLFGLMMWAVSLM